MEIREWAERILSADTLEEKLLQPTLLTDLEPGPPLLIKEPTRPPGMHFQRRSKEAKLPPFQEHASSDKRAECLHRFAGHELLAVEIMAYTLLAFPDAPPRFRKGLASTLKEEQGHVKLYMERMSGFGLRFGDLPLYKHFWAHVPFITSPIHFVSMMNLTFEMANLDFAPMYAYSFKRNGDLASSELMEQILRDEIGHVSFGYNWLKKMKSPEESEWDSWTKTITTTLLPIKRARGFVVHEEPRRQAGLPQDWIDHLKNIRIKPITKSNQIQV